MANARSVQNLCLCPQPLHLRRLRRQDLDLPFCYQRNHFPPHYSMISNTNLLGEVYAQHTTDQYTLPSFRFSCSILAWSRRRWAMSNRLWGVRHAIGLLPENALVGYVSFGTQIQVRELDFFNMFKVLIPQVTCFFFFFFFFLQLFLILF